MNQTTLAWRFAHWSASLTTQTVPPAVRHTARRAILDTFGVIAAGAQHKATQTALAAFGPTPTPTAIALILGTAAHAWDWDDTSYAGINHGSAVVLPAVLAAQAISGADDATALAAFVAGSEIAYTLGEVIGSGHYFRGWWSTITLGLIGATVAACRTLGLSADATGHAIALAAAMAGGGKSVFGTDGKPFLVGMAARNALDLALAAQAGLTGPVHAFEDSRGFLSLLGDGSAQPEIASSLGTRWRLTDPGLLIKSHPVCSAAHAAIEMTAQLCRQACATPDQIAAILCHVPHLVDISLVHDHPHSAQEAQFSLPFAVACAADHGGVRLDDLIDHRFADPDILALMARVRKMHDPALSTPQMLLAAPESARVVLHLADGRRLEGFCPVAYGMPQRPLSDDDLLAKFAECQRLAGWHSNSVTPASLLALGAGSERILTAARAVFWPNAGLSAKGG